MWLSFSCLYSTLISVKVQCGLKLTLNHLKQKRKIVLEPLNAKNDAIHCNIEECGRNGDSVVQIFSFLQYDMLFPML